MIGCLPLTEKDSVTHMQGIEVYVKEGLPFACDLPLENSYLRLFTSPIVFSCLGPSPCSSLCTVFNAVSPCIDRFLSINSSGDSLENLTFLATLFLTSWLTYSGGSNRPGDLKRSFSDC